MRKLLLMAAVLFGATPAFAALPPQVYAEARDNADSVIVISVEMVAPPDAGFGQCQVSGRITAVERGARSVGDEISFDVPCRKPGARAPIGATLYQDADALAQSQWGRAYLTPEGEVTLSQYQILSAAP